MTPNQAATQLLARGHLVQALVREAERETIRLAQQAGENMSQGPYASAQLRAMGHPYATRDPRPPTASYVINRQTGRFASSWRRQLGAWQGDRMESHVRNVSPEARYLDQGTRRMIRRPIREAVITTVAPGRVRRLRTAITRALGHQ